MSYTHSSEQKKMGKSTKSLLNFPRFLKEAKNQHKKNGDR